MDSQVLRPLEAYRWAEARQGQTERAEGKSPSNPLGCPGKNQVLGQAPGLVGK